MKSLIGFLKISVVVTVLTGIPIKSMCLDSKIISLTYVSERGLYVEQDTTKKKIVVINNVSAKAAYFNKVSNSYEAVEVNPEPVGGISAFRQWVRQNYFYPMDAIDAKIKGQLLVSFIVNADGALSDFKIIRDLGHGTGKSLINVLKKSQKWAPALINGNPVGVSYTLPMDINLSN